jgi:hypothetical protein
VGGVYRNRGLEVARKWLILVIQPHVEALYQNMRNYVLPEAAPQPLVPETPYLSPPSSASSGGAGPALSSRDPDDRYRSLPPRVNVPQPEQGPRRIGGGVEEQPEAVNQSRSNRRRRRSSQGNSRSGGSGKQGLISPRKKCFLTYRGYPISILSMRRSYMVSALQDRLRLGREDKQSEEVLRSGRVATFDSAFYAATLFVASVGVSAWDTQGELSEGTHEGE